MTGLLWLLALVLAIAALVKVSGLQRQVIELAQQISALRGELEELRRQRSRASVLAAASQQGDHITAEIDETASEGAPVPEDVLAHLEAALQTNVNGLRPVDAVARDLDEVAEQPAAVPEPPPATEAPQNAARDDASATPTAREAPVFTRDESPTPGTRSDVGGVEQAFATRWTIWLGGIALAVGGLMIVRFSIEAGLFGPKVRLAFGTAFALALGIAAEVIRRRELRIDVGRFRAEDVPSVLAGASVISGFGVVFAAHAVYHLIGSTFAFTLLGAIGLGALAASLTYGRALGLLGLVGSYATPLLVTSTVPNMLALTVFIALVTTAAQAIELRRPSPTLLGGAVAGHAAWTLMIAVLRQHQPYAAVLLIVAALLALLRDEFGGRREAALRARNVDIAASLVPVVLAGMISVEFGGELMLHLALIVVVLAAIVGAIRIPRLAIAAPVAAAGATGYVLLWPTANDALGIAPKLFMDMLRLDIAPSVGDGFVATAILLALAVAVPLAAALLVRHRNGGADPVSRGCLGFAGALAPVAIALAVSLRLNGLERTPLFAAIAAVLTLALAALSELTYRTEHGAGDPRTVPLAYIGSAAYAAAAAIALGLAIAFALRETWLVVGFAVASAGVALIARARPIPLLRTIAAALATAALLRLLWRPIVSDLGTLPLVNWLLVAYGVPAAAFGVAAHALRDRRDRALNLTEGLAAFFITALVLLEVAQGFAGADATGALDLLGSLVNDPSTLVQNRATALIAVGSVAIALLAALFREIRRRTASPIFAGAEALSAVALVPVVVIGLGIAANPLLNGMPVNEPPLLNRLLFDYALTGLVFGALSRLLFARTAVSLLRSVLEGLAVLLVALGATLVARHAFSGPELTARTAATAAYFEAVSMVLLWLALAATVALWRRRAPGEVLTWALGALATFAGVGAVVGLGLARNPLFDGSGVTGPILFNRILWGYAPVAIGFFVVARIAGTGEIARVLRGLGYAATALTVLLLLRHGFHGPMLHSRVPITLAEAGIYATIAFGAAFGLLFFAPDAGTPGHRGPSPFAAAVIVVAVSAGVLAIAAIGRAPLIGWPIVSNSTVGLLLPAAVAALAALWTRAWNLAPAVQRCYGAAAVVGGLLWVLLQVRLMFPPTGLMDDWLADPNATRFYAYSPALLAYGVALLVAGMHFSHRDLRLAALGVIALAALKVFLLDLAGLEGLARAASFIGLGACLIGVAYLYRWLMPPEGMAAKPA